MLLGSFTAATCPNGDEGAGGYQPGRSATATAACSGLTPPPLVAPAQSWVNPIYTLPGESRGEIRSSEAGVSYGGPVLRAVEDFVGHPLRIVHVPDRFPTGCAGGFDRQVAHRKHALGDGLVHPQILQLGELDGARGLGKHARLIDRKSTRLNSSHLGISYAV